MQMGGGQLARSTLTNSGGGSGGGSGMTVGPLVGSRCKLVN